MLQKDTIYQRINQSREDQKMSWEDLSKLVGASRMGLYKSFKNETITVNTMVAVCNALGMSGADLLTDMANVANEPAAEYGKASVPACINQIRGLCDQLDKLTKGSK